MLYRTMTSHRNHPGDFNYGGVMIEELVAGHINSHNAQIASA
jgi:hypothetical protein